MKDALANIDCGDPKNTAECRISLLSQSPGIFDQSSKGKDTSAAIGDRQNALHINMNDIYLALGAVAGAAIAGPVGKAIGELAGARIAGESERSGTIAVPRKGGGEQPTTGVKGDTRSGVEEGPMKGKEDTGLSQKPGDQTPREQPPDGVNKSLDYFGTDGRRHR